MRAWRVTLSVTGPVLTRATAIGGFGVDAPVARDLDGRPIIAGAHLKGKLLQALRDLGDALVEQPMRDRWFGAGAEDAGNRRARLFFGDLRAVRPGTAAASRVRIAIDRGRGVADEGCFQTLEAPYAAGEAIDFEGRLVALVDEDEADRLERALRFGLGWIPQVGGGRTIGFGRVTQAAVKAEPWPVPAIPRAAGAASPLRLAVVLRLLEPFCVTASPSETNLHVGESTIPGGVLKGAMAAQIRAALPDRRQDLPLAPGGLGIDGADPTLLTLRSCFDRMRLLHLRPVPIEPEAGRGRVTAADDRLYFSRPLPTERPRHWPLSLAFGRGGRLADLALAPKPTEVLLDEAAPSFAPDWKPAQWAKVRERFGWGEPPRQLRLRTEIDAEHRSARPQQLFGYEVVLPDRHLWVGEMDLGDIGEADRRAFLGELIEACGGLVAGIGKTDATAQLMLAALPAPAHEGPMAPIDGEGQFVLTLQTPALLCTGAAIRQPPEEEFVAAAERLRRAYAETFRALSDGSLDLVTYFARQRLAGGWFLGHRHQKHGGADRYRPWLLTKAGSVFVLKCRDRRSLGKAQAKLRDWQCRGLPLPPSVRRELGAGDGDADIGKDAVLWDRCPFIRHNGYGEVAINMPVHRQLACPEPAGGGGDRA